MNPNFKAPLYKMSLLEWDKIHRGHERRVQTVKEETGRGPTLVMLVCKRCSQFLVIDMLEKKVKD